jgi:hypothetical protein
MNSFPLEDTPTSKATFFYKCPSAHLQPETVHHLQASSYCPSNAAYILFVDDILMYRVRKSVELTNLKYYHESELERRGQLM